MKKKHIMLTHSIVGKERENAFMLHYIHMHTQRVVNIISMMRESIIELKI
jgi:hypothetical protein